MGAFLAATTHAPIMAILMLFELTLDYQIILPLMLVCVVAYYISSGIEKRSIYSESLQRKGVHDFDSRLARLRVRDLMKADPLSVSMTARFREIAERFISQRFNYLYVVDALGRFVGAVSLHDIKSYLQRTEILDIVIAEDIVSKDFPTLTPDLPLGRALEAFARHIGERLPVISSTTERKLIGQISKTDLILALAQRSPEVVGAAN
jgi:CIC family chloride channel protein